MIMIGDYLKGDFNVVTAEELIEILKREVQCEYDHTKQYKKAVKKWLGGKHGKRQCE